MLSVSRKNNLPQNGNDELDRNVTETAKDENKC